MEVKIKKNIGFDRMSISGKFPSGANFKYSIGRNGETLSLSFSNNREELREQAIIFNKWMQLRKDEINEQRFVRLEQLCYKAKSGKELIALMK